MIDTLRKFCAENKFFAILIFFGVLVTPRLQAQEDRLEGVDLRSSIFTRSSCYLQTQMLGESWQARNITKEDIPFYQGLFSDFNVISMFGDGQTRKPEDTSKRILETWIPRFEKGNPHGALTILQEGQQIGFMIAGGGDRPGTSELAYALMPNYWGRGLGASITSAIVEKWAPEVRRIGLGIGLKEESEAVIQAFRCFGGQPLDQLDATASPSNVASWLILEKCGFKAAIIGVSRDATIIDLTNSELEFKFDTSKETFRANYEALEHFILEKCFKDQPDLFQPGVRYTLISPDGKEFTISKHPKWDRLKFHFEYKIS